MTKKEKNKREATQMEEDPELQIAPDHKAGEGINWGRGKHITMHTLVARMMTWGA